MTRNDYKVRRSLKYRIRMWFYRLTRKDVENAARFMFNGIGELLTCLLLFLVLFFLPHIFH